MRPGIDPASVGALSVGVRVDSLRAGRVIAADIPVSDVRLEWSATRTVPGQLTLTAPLEWTPKHPMDALARFGQRLSVTVLARDEATGMEAATPLGQWLITDWQASDGGVQVTACDLMQVLEDDPMPWPSSPPSGARVGSELQRLAGSLPVVLDPGVEDSLVPVTTQWGCSRTESVVKLAQARGLGLRCGSDGCLHAFVLRDARDPDLVVEAAVLPGRAGNGLLVEAVPAVEGQSRRPNRWVVTGTHTEGEVEQRFTATRTDTAPPFDPASYGWVTRHEEFSAADTAQAVEAAADTYMRSDMEAARSRTIGIVPDPRLEVGDVVAVVEEDGAAWVGRVTAYSLPVSEVGAVERVDLDVLSW